VTIDDEDLLREGDGRGNQPEQCKYHQIRDSPVRVDTNQESE
jgi:hypothetical protein